MTKVTGTLNVIKCLSGKSSITIEVQQKQFEHIVVELEPTSLSYPFSVASVHNCIGTSIEAHSPPNIESYFCHLVPNTFPNISLSKVKWRLRDGRARC